MKSTWLILVIAAVGVTSFVLHLRSIETQVNPVVIPHCVAELSSDFQCYKKRISLTAEYLGISASFQQLKALYSKNPYVVSQCHQFAHTIGNVAVARASSIGEAFTWGDSFCWSGYYHGVVEQAAKKYSLQELRANTNSLCDGVPGKERYSFDYFNCVHGLGHGFMAVTKGRLFEALNLCAVFTGAWERESCYGGVFMENVMLDNREHHSDYLRPDDLLYPCNSVDEAYKHQCYLMQTSYALTKNGRSFKGLFDLCQKADLGYRDICAQSIGRDASGQSVSNATQTHEWCALANDQTQESNCIIGAVKDFISYFHGTKEVTVYCESYSGALQQTCEQTVASYEKTL